ncbi:hypothetical protein H1R20_g13816, partial [Candolleomyces eurysporus]
MKLAHLWGFIVLFNASCLCRAQLSEYFNEKLSIKPLKDGKIASTLTFTTVLKNGTPRDPELLHTEDESQHYRLFPLALGQILREYGVTEMHLTLNAGKWNYDSWGQPAEAGVGNGAELWAWIGDGALARGVQTRRLVAILEPAPAATRITSFRERLLLNPHKLFDANWHGMGVHVLWHEGEGVEVRLTFQTVSDPLRSSFVRKQDWSLESLFGRKVEKACRAAGSSHIQVSLPRNTPYNISPQPTVAENDEALYDIQAVNKPINVAMQYMQEFQRQDLPSSATLSIQRTLKESSQSHGQLSVILRNHQPDPVQAIYLETMPWIVQFYLHTLTATVNDIPQPSVFSNLSYIPAIPHSRPTTFHVLLSIPANSTLRLTMDVTKAFLRYTEHPPDAQRGWDLPPAIIYPLDQPRMYTPTLLVDLATPDFSMPYNVIIFTCTLVAFIFGSIFNLLTRKFVVVSVALKGRD